MERFLRLILGGLLRCEIFVAVLALLSVALALTADVVGRELFGSGIFGAQRYAVFNNALAGLIGFAIVVHLGGHLRVTAIDGLFPPAWTASMDRWADALSGCICVAFCVFAIDFVRKTAVVGDVDPVLGLKVWTVQLVLPYIFAASALRYFAFACCPGLRPAPKEGE
jgi:TRAP-type C4-dicarboxylate transport system permease small subunit